MLKYPLKEIRALLSGDVDLLLCSTSYEIRCRTLIDNIDKSKVRRVAIAGNRNHSIYHGNNPEYLKGSFEGKWVDVTLDTNDPIMSSDNLWHMFDEIFRGSPKRIVIDISTFTHEAVLIIVRITAKLARKEDRVHFAYVAAEYSTKLPPEEKWLSKGIREIRSVVGYPGELMPAKKIHLVVLVGFETDRARALIEAYEPTMISLGYGTEAGSTSPDNFRTNEYFHRKMMALFPTSREFTFSPIDFVDTATKLSDMIANLSDYNVVVAPLNTKLSTIGAAIVAMANEAVQLCYAQAQLYNYENYSEPKDYCYFFGIPGIGGE